jgi:3-oxoacyl-[acyl-carrier protein] reductase
VRQSFEEITITDWRETINNNLNSVFYMAHYVLPKMRQRGWGRIINISGYDGFTGHIDQRAHNVTAKAGMHGLTKAIAREYGIHGITSNTVAPGAIATKRDPEQYKHVDVELIRARLAIKHPGDVRDIAEACLYLAGDSGKYVTGQVIHVKRRRVHVLGFCWKSRKCRVSNSQKRADRRLRLAMPSQSM